jgi:hypothetical protein
MLNATGRGANPPSSLFNFVIVKALYLPPLEVTFKFRLCHQLNVGGIFYESVLAVLGEGSFALIVENMKGGVKSKIVRNLSLILL